MPGAASDRQESRQLLHQDHSCYRKCPKQNHAGKRAPHCSHMSTMPSLKRPSKCGSQFILIPNTSGSWGRCCYTTTQHAAKFRAGALVREGWTGHRLLPSPSIESTAHCPVVTFQSTALKGQISFTRQEPTPTQRLRPSDSDSEAHLGFMKHSDMLFSDG